MYIEQVKKEDYTYSQNFGAYIYNKDYSIFKRPWITKRVGNYWGYCDENGNNIKVEWI